MQDKELTKNEELIIDTIRSLNPFEQVIITADKTGKPGHFLMVRTTKVMLADQQMFMR